MRCVRRPRAQCSHATRTHSRSLQGFWATQKLRHPLHCAAETKSGAAVKVLLARDGIEVDPRDTVGTRDRFAAHEIAM